MEAHKTRDDPGEVADLTAMIHVIWSTTYTEHTSEICCYAFWYEV